MYRYYQEKIDVGHYWSLKGQKYASITWTTLHRTKINLIESNTFCSRFNIQNLLKSLSMSLMTGNVTRRQFLAEKNNTINIYFLTLFKVLCTKRHLNDYFLKYTYQTLGCIFELTMIRLVAPFMSIS